VSINKLNYEEWMVAFMDNELSADEVVEFNEFIKENPSLQEELSAFKTVQFSGDETPIYDGKDALLKKTGAAVLLKKIWPLIAVVLLTVAIGPFLSKDKKVKEKVVAENNIDPKTEIILKPIRTPIKKEEFINEELTPAIKKEISKKVQPIQNETKDKALIIAPEKTIAKKEILKPSEPRPRKKIIEKFDKEIVVKEILKKPEPIASNKEVKNETLLQELNTPASTSKPDQAILEKKENNNALVIIDEVHHPQLYKKMNTVIDQVEQKIETVKKLKKQPIIIKIGKTKIITINK